MTPVPESIPNAAVALRCPSLGFQVPPKRWIIERTNAWSVHPRRLNKDHDRNLAASEGWIWLAEGRRLQRRLTAEMPIQA